MLWGGKWEKLDKRSMNEGCLVGKDLQRLLNATSTTTSGCCCCSNFTNRSFTFPRFSVLLKFLLLAGTEWNDRWNDRWEEMHCCTKTDKQSDGGCDSVRRSDVVLLPSCLVFPNKLILIIKISQKAGSSLFFQDI